MVGRKVSPTHTFIYTSLKSHGPFTDTYRYIWVAYKGKSAQKNAHRLFLFVHVHCTGYQI